MEMIAYREREEHSDKPKINGEWRLA